MKNDLTCAVARDLMPSCADGLASEETNEALRRHLEGCPACSEAYHIIKGEPLIPSADHDEKEIEYLKKLRLKKLRGELISIALCCLLGAAVVFGTLFYMIRVRQAYRPITAADFDTIAQNVYTKTDGSTSLTFAGVLRDITMTAEKYDVKYDKETGRLTFIMELHRADKSDLQEFSIGYICSEPVSSIYLNDVPLWEDGVSVSAAAVRLFETAHPYMGDITQNQKSAAALDITKKYGVYFNELTTSQTPYTWTLLFGCEPDADAAGATPLEDQILLLAAIGNLDAVCFRFPGNDETGVAARDVTLTVENANALTGMDIKEAGRSPAGIQRLIDACRDLLRYASSGSAAP